MVRRGAAQGYAGGVSKEAQAPLPPELREPVSARSLPDGALNGMRRALASLGDLDDDDAAAAPSSSSDDDEDDELQKKKRVGKPSSPSSSSSIVITLAAAELRRETQLWERMVYKSASQHRKAVHFQRMRGVTRHLRALSALDVGAAARALRDGLRAGVSEDARAAALTSPAVAAGAHAIWKLPPRALWEDLERRLRAAAKVAAEADEAMLAAAVALNGQLAHTYFMPFALIATASVARLRASLHQLVVDVVSSYNVLAPLLNDGVMPPPALPPHPRRDARAREASEQNRQMPESLRCEWSPVTPPPPLHGTAPTPVTAPVTARGVCGGGGRGKNGKLQSTSALRPTVCAVEASSSAMGMIDDEDWHWRLLHRVVEREGPGPGTGSGSEVGGRAGARTGAREGEGDGGEDLGAAIPRRVRGLTAQLDRGGSGGGGGGGGEESGTAGGRGHGDGDRDGSSTAPSYSRVAFGIGLGGGDGGGLGTASRSENTAAAAAVDEPLRKLTPKPSPAQAPLAPATVAMAPSPAPMMNIASLTSSLKPQAATDILQPTSSGKKRSRPRATGAGAEDAAGGAAKALASAGDVTHLKKKQKKKKAKQSGGDDKQVGSRGLKSGGVSGGAGKPQTAIDRAMALLMGGSGN